MPTPLARLLRALPVLAFLADAALATVQVAPYFDGVFPTQAPGLTSWKVENAFPNLDFTDPLWIAQVPGSDQMLVVEKAGRILRFQKNAAVTEAERVVALDFSSVVQTSEDQGLYRIAFHPQFGGAGPHANEVFISYSAKGTTGSPDSSFWRLARLTWNPATGTIDPASEQILIQQGDPHRWHNGGALNFDNEGFLLVTCGDGGGENDQFQRSQTVNSGFFGGVLRIDVDKDPTRSHPVRRLPSGTSSFSQDYFIPNDNPWQDASGKTFEEFYAIGLRSPHSAHYDPPTGDLWVGDVGQSGQEELNQVKKGGNYQWPFMEGTLAGPKTKASQIYGVETPPVYSYGRSIGYCIIGGMRYRGERWAPQLGGKVLFGDFGKGNLSAYTPGGSAAPEELVSNIRGGYYASLSNICTDAEGEIYIPQLNGPGKPGGKILILGSEGLRPPPPALLSQTGLFSDTATLQPSPAMFPYEVANPLWSDGAAKKRWIVLPSKKSTRDFAEKITWSAAGNWIFPAGTLFVKHFEIPLDARNPSLVKRLETRVMVCTENEGKYGLTYRWNAAGTDATLISAGEDESFTVFDANGVPEERVWSYPSRANCLECHTNASGQSLGLRTRQLGFNITPPGEDLVNQLLWFRRNSMFASDPSDLSLLGAVQSRAIDDETAPLEHRVRSYLDSNCAHCHQPGGVVPHFDARLTTPLKNQGLVNRMIKGHFNLPGGSYLKAGDPSLSAIHVRAASSVPGIAMPPLGKHVVDAKAMALLAQYIGSLTAEEFATEPVPQARYVRLAGSTGTSRRMTVSDFRILDENGEAIPSSQFSVEAVDSELVAGSASLAIDDSPVTAWESIQGGSTHFITLDLETIRSVGGFEFKQRQDLVNTSRFSTYTLGLSNDGVEWTSFASGSASSGSVRYDSPVGRRPVRTSIAGPAHSYAAEFPVTVSLDTAVTDFGPNDLIVTGGSVKADSLMGANGYYTALITATGPVATVRMPANAVSAGIFGSRESNTITVTTDLAKPPALAPYSPFRTSETFEIRLSFDQAYTGLTREDFTVTGGRLEYLFQEGGSVLAVFWANPLYSECQVRLKDKAVRGANGLWMNGEAIWLVRRRAPVLDSATGNLYGKGFVLSGDFDELGGVLPRWVAEGSRGNDASASENYWVTLNLETPHAGNFRVRARTRADDTGSDSFYIAVGGAASTALPWQTNQNPGERGSGQYHMGWARPAGGQPHLFQVGAGTQSLYVYGAEDGTRIGRIEAIPERPFPVWETLPMVDAGVPVKLTFTSPVSGLSADDFEVMDGSVVGVAGGGKDYVVTLRPDGERMWSRVKENAVTDIEFGGMGVTSMSYLAKVPDWTYDEWARGRQLLPYEYAQDFDNDSDNMGQLIEYALGLDPKRPDAKSMVPGDKASRGLPKLLPEDSPEGKRIVLVYHRRIGEASLEYIPEFGDSPANLTPVETVEEVIPISLQWQEVRVREAVPTNTPVRFARLRVVREW